MPLRHSFNSLSNHQYAKKKYRRQKRIQQKFDCNSLYSEYNDDYVRLSNKKIDTKGFQRKPHKIGYCCNTSENLSDFQNDIYPSFTWSFKNKDLSRILPVGFKNLDEKEKLEIMTIELDYLEDRWYKNIKIGIKDMRKQIKRRGKIGYFKGHHKDYKY